MLGRRPGGAGRRGCARWCGSPGFGGRRRRCSARRSASRVGARHRVDRRRRRAADAGRAGAAPRRSSARRSSQLNEVLPPSGALLNALARFDPFPRIDGPPADVAAAASGDRARPRGRAPPARSVVRVLGTACGARASRARAGSPAPGVVVTNAHVVAGPGRHDGAARRTRAGARRRRPSRSTRATTSRCCASTGWTRRRCESRADVERRARRRRSSGSRSTGRTTSAPARIGPTRTVLTQDAYGAGRCGGASTALRGLVRPATRAARSSTRDGQVVGDGLRRDRRRRARAAATRCPNAIVRATRCDATASAPVVRDRRRCAAG